MKKNSEAFELYLTRLSLYGYERGVHMPETTNSTHTEDIGMEKAGTDFCVSAEDLVDLCVNMGNAADNLMQDWKGNACEAFDAMSKLLVSSTTGAGTRYAELSGIITQTGIDRSELDISAADTAKGE